MDYEIGQEVTLRLGDKVLEGKISDLTVSSAVMTFPVPFDLPAGGTLIWPDGMVTPAGLSAGAAESFLRVRAPFPVKGAPRQPASAPADPAAKAADHRRTVRINVSLPVTIADFTGTRRLLDGRTLNMSSGGTLVLCGAHLVVGRDYTLKLEVLAEPIAFKARVVRRIGRDAYAFRFLADSETGHLLMRRVFMMLRGSEGSSGKRPSWNFRRS